MDQDSEVFVGLDTSKCKISVALAEAGRDGEVRFFGDIDSAPGWLSGLVDKLRNVTGSSAFAMRRDRPATGCIGRSLQLGHECVVVTPSLVPKRPGERVKTNRRDALTPCQECIVLVI